MIRFKKNGRIHCYLLDRLDHVSRCADEDRVDPAESFWKTESLRRIGRGLISIKFRPMTRVKDLRELNEIYRGQFNNQLN